MSSNEDPILPKEEVPPVDLEAPKEGTEDPSVVGTADDSSTAGSVKDTTGSVPVRRKNVFWLGAGLTLVVIAIVVAVVLTTSSDDKNSDERAIKNSLELLNDDVNDDIKTQAPVVVDVEEEPLIEEILEETFEPTESLFFTLEPTSPLFEEFEAELPIELPFKDLDPIPVFSKDIINGYDSVEALEADLTVAVKHMLNRGILRNVYDYYYDYDGGYQQRPRPVEQEENGEMEMEEEEEEEIMEIAQNAGVAASRASASKTNNQEQDADEVDLVKNDETYVYAAYGDYLVVWDRNGTLTSQVRMPSRWDDEDQEEWVWSPPTDINGLLLTPNHVVVMVDSSFTDQPEEAEFLRNHQGTGTHVRIYTKPTATQTDMQLVKTHDLNGFFRDGRWMEATQSLQLLLVGDINTYPHLYTPLRKYKFPGLTPLEYFQAATDLATTTLIPEFVRGLSQALMINGELPNMLQLNSWSANEFNAMTVDEALAQGVNDPFSPDLTMNSYVQVVSLQVTDDVQLQDATPKSSVVLTPTRDVFFYGTEDHVVLAMEHEFHNMTSQHTHEEVYLMHLKGEEFHSVASVPGRTIGPYSLDIQGNDLRIATTLEKWMPMSRVFPLCGDQSLTYTDQCMTLENWVECFDLAIDGCAVVAKTGCPYVYSCEEPLSPEDASSTDNHVYVFDISSPGDMVELGRVRIGDPHEVITAVRFGETFSYAMTFDQRDPFYLLKLDPGQPPVISGSLKMNGFSRYLHPLNEDATLLVGIGQNTTGEGFEQMNSGVMISVFDVSGSQPTVVASEMLDQDDMVESYTQAEWDPKAVQYANGRLVIPVTMRHYGWPEFGDDEMFFNEGNMDDFVDGEEAEQAVGRNGDDQNKNFQGFIVYTVGYTGIQESLRINHGREEGQCHYCNGGLLDSRSILFEDGSLMTMSENSVQSTNIYTTQTLWKMNVTIEGAPLDCCW